MSPSRPPPAQIRFWCLPHSHPELAGLEYLQALIGSEFGVRALAIAGHIRLETMSREVATAFTTDVAKRYVNIVCAPIDLVMGTPRSWRDPKTGEVAGEHKPAVALERLFTVGVPNVAITRPGPITDYTRDALHMYDAVLAPDLETAKGLRLLGIPLACGVSPDVAALKELVTALLPPTPDRA